MTPWADNKILLYLTKVSMKFVATLVAYILVLFFILPLSYAISPTFFGIQTHSLQSDVYTHTAVLDKLQQLGVKILRDEMYWSNVELNPGRINIPTNYLTNVDNTIAYGIELLLILDYGNRFYDNGLSPYTDTGRKGYAKYAAEIVKTFRGKIKFYEIWNEPNITVFWKPQPNPQNYFLLLKETYPTCKSVNPESIIFGGVTSQVDLPFIESILLYGASSYMDGISVHQYVAPASPESAGIKEQVKQLRKLMDKYGMLNKPIWVTEIGWSTYNNQPNVPVVTVDNQANFLVRAYLELYTSRFIDRVFWYQFHADGVDPYNPEHHYGLFYSDNTPKPAFYAYQNMTKFFTDSFNSPLNYYRELKLSPETKGYQFQKGTEMLFTTIWSTSTPAIGINMYVGANRNQPVTGYDRDGVVKQYTVYDNKISLIATGLPLYFDFYFNPFIINGKIKNVGEQGIPNVQVKLIGDLDKNVFTDETGVYTFTEMLPGNFIVSPLSTTWHFRPEKYQYTELSENQENQDFNTTQTIVSLGDVKIQAGINGYFNPLTEQAMIVINPTISERVNIKIYTLIGTLVWETKEDVIVGTNKLVPWTGRDLQNQVVASGIYIVYVTGAGLKIKKQIAVVK